MIHSIYIFSRVLTKDFKLIYLSLIGKIFLYIKVKYIFCEHRVCSFWQNIHFILKYMPFPLIIKQSVMKTRIILSNRNV